MIYLCKDCHYLFQSSEPAERCPDCGKVYIRPANEKEQKEFWNYQHEFHPELLAANH